MDALTMIFLMTSVIGAALVIWSHTKSGKKWLKDLDMIALYGFGLITVITISFWIYTETPSGKKWIKRL